MPTTGSPFHMRRDFEGTQPWMAEAACRGMDTNFFFPERGNNEHTIAQAKRVCEGCPVRQPCLEYALAYSGQHDAGIWAGTTEKERRRLRRQRRRVA